MCEGRQFIYLYSPFLISHSLSLSLSLSFSNRKGKLIFFYEWNVKLKWKGTLTPEDPPTDDEKEVEDPTEYSGEIEIPNLSEENDPEDIDVSGCGFAINIQT